jgi:hypothetical protein
MPTAFAALVIEPVSPIAASSAMRGANHYNDA